MLIQAISVIGALCVLMAYAAHQLGRMRSDTYLYQLLNLSGGALLVTAAWTTRQAGLILMEGAWTVISVYGVVKVMRAPRR